MVRGKSFSGRAAEGPKERFEEIFAAFIAKYGKEAMESYYPRKEVALEVPLPA